MSIFEHISTSYIVTRQIWGIWKLRPAYSPETPNLGQNRWCFVPRDLEIWRMTLENNRASLLCCFKFCATFHSHRWIQTGVTVRKLPIWVKFDDFCSRVTLKFDRWHWGTTGHLFYATPSFVHPLVAICEFKLELQSGNAQFGSKSTIFFSRVTLKFDAWPWKTIGHLFYVASSFVHHSITIGEFKMELQSGNAQFGSKSMIFFSRVTSKFDLWPWKAIGRLFYVASSFVHHFITIGEFKMELQSGNAQFGSKSIFFSRVTSKFDLWPWKTIGHLFYVASTFAHHFITIGEFKLELQSGNAQFGSKSMIF